MAKSCYLDFVRKARNFQKKAETEEKKLSEILDRWERLAREGKVKTALKEFCKAKVVRQKLAQLWLRSATAWWSVVTYGRERELKKFKDALHRHGALKLNK